MVIQTEFAVVDLETTGLFPKRGDKIIEFAAIRLDGSGEIVREYNTLINPNRDLGPVNIHGITAKEIKNAPIFSEVAGDVVSMLSGAVFVAHNASFDTNFIYSEMAHIGYDIPLDTTLCTISLARMVYPNIPCRKLGLLCNYFDIPLERHHSAFSDALATSNLFNLCIEKIGDRSELNLSDIGIDSKPAPSESWPDIPKSGKSWTRTTAKKHIDSEPSYIARLIEQLPSFYMLEPNIDEYLALLDRYLEDRIITEEESESLIALAEDIGLYREDVIDAHSLYMRALIQAALEDGVITQSEERDLRDVQKILNISDAEYKKIFQEVNNSHCGYEIKSIKPEIENLVGKTICFTGAFTSEIEGNPIKRSFAENIAREKGMVVTRNVTKSLNYLVAADPESMSGKAKNARKYGVRIIAEPVFWKMAGVEVD